MSTATPRVGWFLGTLWAAAALAAGAALALGYGFVEPPVCPCTIRTLFLVGVGLFAASRVLVFLGPSRITGWLARWWVDYLLLAAGVIWWWVDRSRESDLLLVAAAYIAGGAVLVAGRAMLSGLADGWPHRAARPFTLLTALLFLAVVLSASVLWLPVFWRGSHPVASEHPSLRYILMTHWVDCAFTATSALTGTGLATQEIGRQYTPAGQWIVAGLMQVGGLGVFCLAGVLVLRWRGLAGWGWPGHDLSPGGLRRVLGLTVALVLLVELLGAAGLWTLWDSGSDPAFRAAGEGLAPRALYSAFHSISATCGNGLTLPRDALIAYRERALLPAVVLPLMIIGLLGAPVWLDWLSALARRGSPPRTSREARWTLILVVLFIAGGAGLLTLIEQTRHQQLRFPREQTPGRLMVATAPSSTMGSDSSHSLQQARPGEALVVAASGLGGGLRTMRLDEGAVSPASQLVLCGLMFIGGGAGGAAGGVRIIMLLIVLGAVFGRGRRDQEHYMRRTARGLALRTAGTLFAGMTLLVAVTWLALVYREVDSPLACLFEAISACCNNGLTAGVTARLSVQGKVALMLAMMIGRVLPLAVLARALGDYRSSTIESSGSSALPLNN